MNEKEMIIMHMEYCTLMLFSNFYIPHESPYWYDLNSILIYGCIELRDKISKASKLDIAGLYNEFIIKFNDKLDKLNSEDSIKLRNHINAQLYVRLQHIPFNLKHV